MNCYYQELRVWKESINLCKEIYTITKPFPKEEIYSLVDQIKRCSVSVSSNIAEGSGRRTNKDFIQFLYIAKGSAFELQTQLIISKELGFIKEVNFKKLDEQIIYISKMLSSLISSLSKN